MTTFDDRGKAFEQKFAMDGGMEFKARARRNKLLGEWIATELLGMKAEEVKDYAAAVVKADLEEHGDDDVIRKVHADLETAGVDFSDHRIEKQLAVFMEQATKQIMDEA